MKKLLNKTAGLIQKMGGCFYTILFQKMRCGESSSVIFEYFKRYVIVFAEKLVVDLDNSVKNKLYDTLE
jgi:hypothetical protein